MPSPLDASFEPGENRIFVFGSNLSGIHGAGAANYAYTFQGAEWEVGEGLTGMAYAIPTKGHRLEVLPLTMIKQYVDKFLAFAATRPDLTFFVTRIGCGLAGYADAEISPMFETAPLNCELPPKWVRKGSRIDSFSGEYRFLSNFWITDIQIYNISYRSVEHAYQAMKTTDIVVQTRIMNARTPTDAKRIGKEVQLRPDWEQVKLDYMRYLVWYKFANHQPLKEALLATGDKELVEGNNWGDRFWGQVNGEGENWLGKILMEVRTKLRTQ